MQTKKMYYEFLFGIIGLGLGIFFSLYFKRYLYNIPVCIMLYLYLAS